MPIHFHTIYGCFQATATELSSWWRLYGQQNLFNLGSYKKMFADPWFTPFKINIIMNIVILNLHYCYLLSVYLACVPFLCSIEYDFNIPFHLHYCHIDDASVPSCCPVVVLWLFCFVLFCFLSLFIYSWETQRKRQRHRQREEKQAPCREPDVGLDPRSQDYTLSQKQTLNC